MGRTRHQSTYGELFQTHLEHQMELGARAYRMLTLAAMYERRDEDSRQREFEEWLRSTGAFQCNRCGDAFSKKDAVKEDDQILCVTCWYRS
jgi:formylmethanofuran dehydrogenase subunit E